MSKLFSYAATMALATALIAAETVQAQEITHKIGGRVQMDWSMVDADNANMDWNATELRRLRLGVSGKVGDDVKYKVELNTNSSEDVNVEDAYVQWSPKGGDWSVKLGQFKTHNSLDEQTSSRFISTLERAAFTDAFEFNRRLGLAVGTSGDNYTINAGVFGDNLSTSSAEEGHAISVRATFTPVNDDSALVHLGASARYRKQGDTQSDFRYRQRPVSHIPSRIISTGRVAESDVFYGVEAAAIMGQFWTSGEYGVLDANCNACASDPSFHGQYVEAGVFFGGQKTYKGGKFNRPKVDKPITDGGMGAFSVVARYDSLDLQDQSVNGGDLDSLVLGADWWPTKYTRIGVNYFDADANLGSSTSGLDAAFAALVTGGITEEEVSGFNLRAQFDF
ncbi:MAG: hypothetical protein HKN36_13785 [Hellea sp.]|nr:hypothetical protein [Hellea sp.]